MNSTRGWQTIQEAYSFALCAISFPAFIKRDLLRAPEEVFTALLTNYDSQLQLALRLGISEEALSKISAVLVYMLPEGCLLFNDFRYIFATRQYRIIVNPFASKVDANKIHELTRLAVHFPEELADPRIAFFSLEDKDWDRELREMSRIIIENAL